MTTHLSRSTKTTRSLIKPLLLFAVIVIVAPLYAGIANAQEETKPFEARFWEFLIGNNYKNWAPAPGQDGDFYSGRTPHGALQKMYINRLAAGDVKGLKPGSLIVLENYQSDRSLKSISVMYRTEGFNPEANDWYWIEYEPDGTVAERISTVTSDETATIMLTSATSTKLMGKATSCIACHKKASGSDFAFFNDGDKSRRVGKKPAKSLSLK